MNVKAIGDIRAQLGECPVWSAVEAAVYWIDILGKHLHRTDPTTGATDTWDLPSHPGMIARRGRGGLVVALQDGLYGFDPATGGLEHLVALEDDVPGNRANDGKVDPSGRLWLGTMNLTDTSDPSGSLYRIDPDLTVTMVHDGYRVPNGLAWSPDGTRMYHTDTKAGVVAAYAYDAETGTRSDPQPFFGYDRETTGGVDGAAMDTDGGYWAAFYGGAAVARILPDGDLDTVVPLPVSQPTMPAFGGPDGRTLYMTSARQKLNAEELAAEPLAGGLLAVTVDRQGQPIPAFGG